MKKNILDKIVIETITEVLAEEQLDVTIKENKGQDEAIDLIQKLRNSTYPKLSDAELEAFGFEMFTHFKDYGEMKPNHMDLREDEDEIKNESIIKRLREDANYKEFFLKTLKMFGVKSPKDLSTDKKKEFFDYVDKNYKAKAE